MESKKRYKIVLYVPESHSEKLRKAIGDAGAGMVGGKYTHCSFTVKGTGRFTPITGANPAIGEINKMEEVLEDRIETVCEGDKLKDVLKAIKEAHPYEELATNISTLEVFE